MALGSDEVHSASTFGVPLAGMALNYYITRDMEIKYGSTNFSYLGGRHGASAALLLTNSLTGELDQQTAAISIIAGGIG